jgi:hypothetical protein
MPSIYQPASQLDNPRWSSSSPPCCDLCALHFKTISQDHYTLGTFICLIGHAPTTTIPRTGTQGWTPSYQLIRTGSGQKSSSPSSWQICFHKRRYHQTIGLQFTPTHGERANQHPLARLQDKPTLAGTTAKPHAKSKQTPTLIAPQAQTLHTTC